MILQKSDSTCLKLVASALKRGELVIIPTDTVYGFSGIVPEGGGPLYEIKGREKAKPFIHLVAEPSDIGLYSDTLIPEKIRLLIPGALTLIVEIRENCFFDGFVAQIDKPSFNKTAAFRCPKDEWLRSLIRLCGKPLYSTSVNRSGCPLFTDVQKMETEFGSEVFCLVDGGHLEGQPSTILDISKGEIKVLRQGSVNIFV